MAIQRDYEVRYEVDDTKATPPLRRITLELITNARTVDQTADAYKRLQMEMSQLAAMTAGQLNPAIGGATGGIDGLHKSILGMAGSWFVLEHGVEALGKFGELANKTRDMMKELGENVRNMRDDFRELANLQGKAGPDDEVVAETVKKGAEAGMMPAEARRFMEQFLGSSPAGEQKKNINAATAEALSTEGMKFGTRVKLAPQTAGDLTGVLSQYSKIHSVEEGAGQLGQIAYGLNEGRGNLEPLMRSLIKTAGAVVSEDGGPIDSMPHLAAIMGVASTHASPDAAGTKVRKAARALRQFKGAQGDALQRHGIDGKDTYLQALGKIAPKIVQADKEGIGGDIYLRSIGFSDEAEITALVEQSRDLKIIRERIKNQDAITGKSVMKSNQDYLATDRNGQSRQIRAAKAATDYARGAEQERFNMAKDAAEIEMRDKGEVGGFRNNVQEWIGDMGGLKPFLGMRKTKDRWIEERAMDHAETARWKGLQAKGLNREQIVAEMKKADPTFEPNDPGGYFLDDAGRRKKFNANAKGVEQSRGNPYIDTKPITDRKLDELIGETKETNQILRQQALGVAQQIGAGGGWLGLAAAAAAVPAR